MKYIQVILPIRLQWNPFYLCQDDDVSVGMRVEVPFAGRLYVGVVCNSDALPDLDPSRILEVKSVIDGLCPVSKSEILLWNFISDYYLCSVGEVYKTAYPSVKISGEQSLLKAQERRMLLKSKALEQYGKRIDRLQKRLDKLMSMPERNKTSIEKINAELQDVRQKMKDIEDLPLSKEVSPVKLKDFSYSGMVTFRGKTVLIAGGTGRRDFLLDAIAEKLAAGSNVLFLVPNIYKSNELKTVLVERFGQDSLLSYTPSEKNNSKRDVASALRKGTGPYIVLGTKTAVFLPFEKLRLIIVEGEHDTLYKQDYGPRYNARDTAIMLGNIHGADVILSSPTPSLESMLNCLTNKYELMDLEDDNEEMEVIDTSKESRKNGMVGEYSRKLIEAVYDTARKKEKVLIIRAWGTVEDIKASADTCFPDVAVDVSNLYGSHLMDLSSYGLIALTGFDFLFSKQDFRADERLFQNLIQIRSGFKGRLLVQTAESAHPVFYDRTKFMRRLLSERKQYGYPPYRRMIDIVFNDTNPKRLKLMCNGLKDNLSSFEIDSVFSPLKGKEELSDIRVIRLLLNKDSSLSQKKHSIQTIIAGFEKERKYTGHIIIDVDPVF